MLDFSYANDLFDLNSFTQNTEWKKFADKYHGELEPASLLFNLGSMSIPLQQWILFLEVQPILHGRTTAITLSYSPTNDFRFITEKKGWIAALERWPDISNLSLVKTFSPSSILDKSLQFKSNDEQKCIELFSDPKLLKIMEEAPDLLPFIDSSSYKTTHTFDLCTEIPGIVSDQERLEFIRSYFLTF